MLLKNDSWKNISKNLGVFLSYEIKKFFYNLFFETKNLKAIWDVMKLRKKFKKKKEEIMALAKNPDAINKWIEYGNINNNK